MGGGKSLSEGAKHHFLEFLSQNLHENQTRFPVTPGEAAFPPARPIVQ
jgi:hypothetical protein